MGFLDAMGLQMTKLELLQDCFYQLSAYQTKDFRFEIIRSIKNLFGLASVAKYPQTPLIKGGIENSQLLSLRSCRLIERG